MFKMEVHGFEFSLTDPHFVAALTCLNELLAKNIAIFENNMGWRGCKMTLVVVQGWKPAIQALLHVIGANSTQKIVNS